MDCIFQTDFYSPCEHAQYATQEEQRMCMSEIWARDEYRASLHIRGRSQALYSSRAHIEALYSSRAHIMSVGCCYCCDGNTDSISTTSNGGLFARFVFSLNFDSRGP